VCAAGYRLCQGAPWRKGKSNHSARRAASRGSMQALYTTALRSECPHKARARAHAHTHHITGTHAHARTRTRTHTHAHARTRTHTHVYARTRTHTTRTHACTKAYMHKRMRAHMHPRSMHATHPFGQVANAIVVRAGCDDLVAAGRSVVDTCAIMPMFVGCIDIVPPPRPLIVAVMFCPPRCKSHPSGTTPCCTVRDEARGHLLATTTPGTPGSTLGPGRDRIKQRPSAFKVVHTSPGADETLNRSTPEKALRGIDCVPPKPQQCWAEWDVIEIKKPADRPGVIVEKVLARNCMKV